MNKTQQLRDLGQSLWLDNITRHFGEIGGRHLREPFAEEPSRGERFAAEAAGLCTWTIPSSASPATR